MDVQAVAIRYPALDETAGVLKGLRPIVFTAEQGLAGASFPPVPIMAAPLAAGAERASEWSALDVDDMPRRHASKFEIYREIFIVDVSGSTGDPVVASSPKGKSKLDHMKQEFAHLNDALVPAQTKKSLIAFSDSAVELVKRDNCSHEVIRAAFNNLTSDGCTSFVRALEIAIDIVSADHLKTGQKTRTAIVFQTDGHDYRRDVDSTQKLLFKLRDLNATMLCVGVGEGYSMPRIVELAGDMGNAVWGHTPMMHRTSNLGADYFDIFRGFMPRMVEGLTTSESYLRFDVGGQFSHLTSASQSIFPMPGGLCSVYSGYTRKGRGLLLEGNKENIELSLVLASDVTAQDRHKMSIPIVDADKAGDYFEEKQLGEELITQWLASDALHRGDIGALKAISQTSKAPPGIADFIDRLARRTQGRSDSDLSQSHMYSDETVCGTWTGDTRQATAREAKNVERVNDYSVVDKDAEGISPTGVLSREDLNAGLHSGGVGPLDTSASITNLPPAVNPNAAAYGKARFNLNPHLVYLGSGGATDKEISLIRLLTPPYAITAGRGTCDIRFKNDSISRRHFEIVQSDGKFTIRDLGSSNGTFVNERMLKPHEAKRLSSGDLVRVAGYTFRFGV